MTNESHVSPFLGEVDDHVLQNGRVVADKQNNFINVTIVQSEPKWLKNAKNKCL